MRLEVTIPDPLIDGARRAAAALGLSLEAYVADAVELRLQDDPEQDSDSFFTPQVVAEIRAAQAEARTGNNITIDQYRAEAKLRNAEWRANHPD